MVSSFAVRALPLLAALILPGVAGAVSPAPSPAPVPDLHLAQTADENFIAEEWRKLSRSNDCGEIWGFWLSYSESRSARSARRRLARLGCDRAEQMRPVRGAPSFDVGRFDIGPFDIATMMKDPEPALGSDFRQLRNQFIEGRTIRRAQDVSHGKCQDLCRNSRSCDGYTFLPIYGTCTLMASPTDTRSYAGALSALRAGVEILPPPPPPQVLPPPPPPPSSVTFSEYSGYDLPGNDITLSNGKPFVKTTLPDCRARCRNEQRCMAFTFNHRYSACFMKSRVSNFEVFKDATSAVVQGR